LIVPDCPLAVAFTVMSFVVALKADPELLAVTEAPEVAERLILFAPAVTVHVVELGPVEFSVAEVVYPLGDWPLNHQIVFVVDVMVSGTVA
jgi:hypothetical protein